AFGAPSGHPSTGRPPPRPCAKGLSPPLDPHPLVAPFRCKLPVNPTQSIMGNRGSTHAQPQRQRNPAAEPDIYTAPQSAGGGNDPPTRRRSRPDGGGSRPQQPFAYPPAALPR